MLGQKRQEGAADKCEVGQEVWLATAGAVFSEDDVTPPMVSNFHTSPVPANQSEPLRRAVLLGQCAGQVVVRLSGALVGFFDAPGIAQHNQTSSKGEIGLHGLDGEGVQATGFDSSVSGFAGDKKGVCWSASSR